MFYFKKMMNGYVRQAFPMVFFFCLLGIAFLVFTIASIQELLFEDIPLDTIEVKLVIYEMVEEPPLIVFKTDHGEMTVLNTSIKDKEKLYSSISHKNAFYAVCERDNKKTDQHTGDIWSLIDNEKNVFFTPEDVLQSNKSRLIKISIGFSITTVLYWTIGVFCYCILSNAPRHKWLASLLIRKGYRNF